MNLITKLKQLHACPPAIEWVGERTIEEAWAECPRGDWILWFYVKLYPNNIRERTLAAGHCANTVRHLIKDQRSIDAVDAAIAFGEGKINERKLMKVKDAASDAAYAAYAAAAYAAASDAAYATASAAAAYAAAYAAYPHATVYAATYAYAAAAASAASASYAAASTASSTTACDATTAYAANTYSYETAKRKNQQETAKRKNQQETADICRKYLTLGDLQ